MCGGESIVEYGVVLHINQFLIGRNMISIFMPWQVRQTMRDRGAVPVSDVTDMKFPDGEENADDDDDDAGSNNSGVGGASKTLKSISLTQDGREAKKEEIAIKTSSLFKVLKDLGLDSTGDDQKRVLKEVQRIDNTTGYFTLNQMLALFRAMDNHWEIQERRQQVVWVNVCVFLVFFHNLREARKGGFVASGNLGGSKNLGLIVSEDLQEADIVSDFLQG